jgi:hypothetical protein
MGADVRRQTSDLRPQTQNAARQEWARSCESNPFNCRLERCPEPRLRGEGKRGIWVCAATRKQRCAGKNPGPSAIFATRFARAKIARDDSAVTRRFPGVRLRTRPVRSVPAPVQGTECSLLLLSCHIAIIESIES